ncbi:LysR family transcriptional regulator [Burkholderia pseudomallei]|uniref:LysR family transcriptional regulator n=1 Tax=Burkholderia pseudomallei TaxID=28450 RepID=UPI000DC4FE39|nr:LysR family transcriptional regulator [Burkholderia pseudomallei]RAQ91996.1 LysR family transcriptional regulator [Burkholderia pseudomallei]
MLKESVVLHGIGLKYFVEVARTGSLAVASQQLHVAVSAISRQIAKLEEQVGTPLFERMPRGMILTEAGELLVQHARRALMDGDAVLAEISEIHALGLGIVRIGCTEGFTRCFLPSVMATHYRQHPRTRFVMRSGTPAQVEHWVASGEVDMGLAFSTSTSTALSVEYSVKAPVCALLPPTHPLAGRTSVTLDDILQYPTAVLDRGTTVRQLIDLCCSARGVHLEPILTSNNSSAMHHFAALAGTITLGSQVALEGNPGPPTLVATPIDEPLLNERLLQVTVMRERRLPPAVVQFLKTLSNALRESQGASAARARRKKR